MPGVLTVWKRSTEASGQTMNDFNVMKTAFPDMYERRLEEVASNLYRGNAELQVSTTSAMSNSARSSPNPSAKSSTR